MATMPRDEAIFTIIETEFPTILLEDIEDLARKVNEGTKLESAIQSLLASAEYYEPSDEPALQGAYARLVEIEKLPDDALRSLAEEVELKSVEQEANEKRRLKEERILNDSSVEADFEHFKRLAYWNTDEAACLLLGKDPRHLSRDRIADFSNDPPFARRYSELSEHITRAAKVGVIGNPEQIDPLRLLPWALSVGIDVPESLLTNYSEIHDKAAPTTFSPHEPREATSAAMQVEMDELRKKLKTAQSASTNWRRATLLLLHALLHGRFTDGPSDKPASLQEIKNFVDQVLERELDPGTIKARLDEIAKMLPDLQKEIASGRGNTASASATSPA